MRFLRQQQKISERFSFYTFSIFIQVLLKVADDTALYANNDCQSHSEKTNTSLEFFVFLEILKSFFQLFPKTCKSCKIASSTTGALISSMRTFDKHFLTIQFKLSIFSKKGSEFQSFVERIFTKAFPEFEKVRPYGNVGDGGNDGFIRRSGTYYQIYAPKDPFEKDSETAAKIINDFSKLIKSWNHISPIRKFCFVYNDNFSGTTLPIENAIISLKTNYQGIEFETIHAESLQKIFFTLDEADFIELGFSIDSRMAYSLGKKIIEEIQMLVDRENTVQALQKIEETSRSFQELDNPELETKLEYLRAKCFEIQEQLDQAEKIYLELAKKLPAEQRPLLHLAQIFLTKEDFEKNLEYLNAAEEKTSKDELFLFHKLNRQITAVV